MGIPFTITMGFLFTITLGIQFTVSRSLWWDRRQIPSIRKESLRGFEGDPPQVMACWAFYIISHRSYQVKGLERPAVVVTGLRYVKDRLGTRMNIALTRALGVVRIIGEEGVLQQDPMLANLD